MSLSNRLQRTLQVALGKAAGLEATNDLNSLLAAQNFSLVDQQYQSAINTAGFTATAAQLAGAENCVLELKGTLGAGANITTPTAAAIFAGILNAVVGETYRLRIINSSSAAFAWTVVGGTNVTITGTATIAQNTWRDFIVTLTDATHAALQAVGTGTQS